MILSSSLGKKVLMAISGLLLVGFVVVHLMGNLLMFLGPDALNAYAVKLRHLGPMLWGARLVLVSAVIVHIWTSIQVTLENRRARPARYRVYRPVQTTWAARTMMLSGVLLLVYIAYHLLHFTFGVTNPEISHLTDLQGRRDVYSMVVLSFQNPWISIVYLIGMALLCAHLSHGIASTFQSLGLGDERLLPVAERIGHALAAALFVGYSAIPIAVFVGFVRLPGH